MILRACPASSVLLSCVLLPRVLHTKLCGVFAGSHPRPPGTAELLLTEQTHRVPSSERRCCRGGHTGVAEGSLRAGLRPCHQPGDVCDVSVSRERASSRYVCVSVSTRWPLPWSSSWHRLRRLSPGGQPCPFPVPNSRRGGCRTLQLRCSHRTVSPHFLSSVGAWKPQL